MGPLKIAVPQCKPGAQMNSSKSLAIAQGPQIPFLHWVLNCGPPVRCVGFFQGDTLIWPGEGGQLQVFMPRKSRL